MVGIGNQNTMVELMKNLSRNAKEPRFSKRPSQLKKEPKQVKHRKFSEYHTFVRQPDYSFIKETPT